MPLSGAGIVEVHATFGERGEVVERRRAIYRAAVECHLGREVANGIGVGVVDNPMVRAHLGAVLAGTGEFDPAALRDLDELVDSGYVATIGNHPVRLATAERAEGDLAGALERIGAAVIAGRARSGPDRLVLASGSRAERVWRTVCAGITLALDVLPELSNDLLPHISLVAVVSGRASRLGSASLRDYPGLILMPEPATAMEVAEAIVHEGAHQKFFDLAITHPILGSGNEPVRGFRASWAPLNVALWPAEQCLAAFHTYLCLAALWPAVVDRGPAIELHPGSLLPNAAARSAEIGDWLARYQSNFGSAGRRLIRQLMGEEFVADAREAGAEPRDELWRQAIGDHDRPAVIRDCGRWSLVMLRGRPAEIFWVRTDRLVGARLAAGGR